MKKKNYKPLNIKLDAVIAEQLDAYSDKTKLSKTAIVELALIDYLKKRKTN